MEANKILYEFRTIRREMWKSRPNCAYCGKPADELHHIIPRIYGGDNRPSNLVPLCEECHYKAHGKSFYKSGNRGRKKIPTHPNFDDFAHDYLSGEYSLAEVLEILEMSKGRFYDRLKEYRARTDDCRDHRDEIHKRGMKLYERGTQ